MTYLKAVRAMLLLVPGLVAGQAAGPGTPGTPGTPAIPGIPGTVAVIRVSPTSVMVNSQGPSTTILTFSGLGGYTPAEGTWCAAVVSGLDYGVRCDPATIYGQAPRPMRLVSAAGVFTDVMTVSASVVQRAPEAALAGAAARVFFVRRFEAPATAMGPGADQYGVVALLLGGSGANAPFALTNVRLRVDPDVPVLFVKRGTEPPPVQAAIAYTGSGRLRGRWEVVMPGEAKPSVRDLMTEGSLPSTERGLQRRYLEIQRFNVLLLPNGRYTLPGPDPSRLPTTLDGSYSILLRVEASDDARSDLRVLDEAGSGTVVHNGASAAFPMPTFRYIVGATGARVAPSRIPQNVRLRLPIGGATVAPDAALTLSWTDVAKVERYRVDIENVADGATLLSAIVAPGVGRYAVPPFAVSTAPARWRITALDAAGREIGRREWRRMQRRRQP